MRTAFASRIERLASEKNLVLITGDLGYGVFESFEAAHPERFLNAGITEQSMTSLAAGLADEGFVPILYSIANFPTMRNFEQIRNDLAYPNRHAVITSVGAGLSYGSLGSSHFGIEDIGAMHILPNMTIFSPSDPLRAELATDVAVGSEGPAYLRLGKNGEPPLGSLDQSGFVPVRRLIESRGNSVVFSVGSIGNQVCNAAAQSSHSIDVYSVEQVWPLPKEVFELAHKYDNVGFVEEHVEHGGLFSLFSHEWAKLGQPRNFLHKFVDRSALRLSGSHAYMLEQTLLDERSLSTSFSQWLSS